MKTNYDEFYRKHRTRVLLFGRWRMHTYRSHPERGYTRHWHLYGRAEDGKLERSINDFQLSAYRIRHWRLAAEVTVAAWATGADALQFFFALPFLGMVFLSAGRAGKLPRWLGVEYEKGKDGDDLERRLGLDWNNSHISVSVWANSEKHWGGRFRYIDLKDRLLGRAVYSRTRAVKHTAVVRMPEGDYPAEVELYTATWRRPRWPRPLTIGRADVKVIGRGIPFPGKGESEYDLGDDAAFEMTAPASTVDEAVERLRASVMRDREKYGGPGWLPLNTTDDGDEEVK